MRLTIRNVQFHPNDGPVAVLVENALSQFYVNLDQKDLAARAGGENWGDDDVLAAVQANIDADARWAELHFVVEYPPKPPTVAVPEPAAPQPQFGTETFASPAP